MKFIAFFFVSILIVVFINPIVPFWVIMILIALAAALLGAKGVDAFFAGGLAMGLAWLGQTIYISITSASQLSDSMSELMGLGTGMVMHILTGVLGFLLGSFSAWTGSLLRNVFKRRPNNIYKG
jgi:hypothetical protein